MRKNICLLVFMICATSLFATEVKTYVTGAYNYGMFTERSDVGNTVIKSNGFDIGVATFFNEGSLGLYLNTDYNFPESTEVNIKGLSLKTSSSDWNFSMIISGIIGPVFKYNFTDNLVLNTAGGFHIAQYSLSSDYVSMLSYSFGIGGDIGLRYFPTDKLYLTTGCLLTHDFYNVSKITTAFGTSNNSDAYNFGSFRPYIGIGFNFTEHLN